MLYSSFLAEKGDEARIMVSVPQKKTPNAIAEAFVLFRQVWPK